MADAGIDIELHHHEVATAGQCEIDMRFDSLLVMADKLQKYKYIVRNTARQHGYAATFMPKPLFGDNGSGMHVHQSLWKNGETLFFDESKYALLSDTARYYIGGILKHAPALLALCAPTTNSYRRLVPGFEAPINLVYSMRNRSAAIRHPHLLVVAQVASHRVPRPRCHLQPVPGVLGDDEWLASTAPRTRSSRPRPSTSTSTSCRPRKRPTSAALPARFRSRSPRSKRITPSCSKAASFTEDLLSGYIDWKYSKEIVQVALRPHPYEFFMYFDA